MEVELVADVETGVASGSEGDEDLVGAPRVGQSAPLDDRGPEPDGFVRRVERVPVLLRRAASDHPRGPFEAIDARLVLEPRGDFVVAVDDEQHDTRRVRSAAARRSYAVAVRRAPASAPSTAPPTMPATNPSNRMPCHRRRQLARPTYHAAAITKPRYRPGSRRLAAGGDESAELASISTPDGVKLTPVRLARLSRSRRRATPRCRRRSACAPGRRRSVRRGRHRT